MSCLNARIVAGEGEEEDAALVDSFFLPGGILDPDFLESELNNYCCADNGYPSARGSGAGLMRSAFGNDVAASTIATTRAAASTTLTRAIPSNPWSSLSVQKLNDANVSYGGLIHEAESVPLAFDRTASALGSRPTGHQQNHFGSPDPSKLPPSTPDRLNIVKGKSVSSPTIRPPPGNADYDRGSQHRGNAGVRVPRTNVDNNGPHSNRFAQCQQTQKQCNEMAMGHLLDMNPMNLPPANTRHNDIDGYDLRNKETLGYALSTIRTLNHNPVPAVCDHTIHPLQLGDAGNSAQKDRLSSSFLVSSSNIRHRPFNEFNTHSQQHRVTLPNGKYDSSVCVEVCESPPALERRLINAAALSFLSPPPANDPDTSFFSKSGIAERNVGENVVTGFLNACNEQTEDHDGLTANDAGSSGIHVAEEEEDSVRSSSSVPLELLSIRGIYKGDSLTSSLSTSTCDSDVDEDTVSVIGIDGEQEDELEDNMDHDGAWEQSEVVVNIRTGLAGPVGSPGCASQNNANQARRAASPSTLAQSPTKRRGMCQTVESEDLRSDESESLLELLRVRLQQMWAVVIAKRVPHDTKAIFRHVQPSRIDRVFRQMMKSCSSRTEQMTDNLRVAGQWLGDIHEVLSILVSQLLFSLRVVLVTTTKALILLASFMLQVWMYSLIEAVEEPHVTICYIVFYLMPRFCSVLTEYLNLPHWTPHLITSMSVFALCNQVSAGPLHAEASSILFNLADATSAPTPGNFKQTKSRTQDCKPQQRAAASTNREQTTPRDERACKTILRILRLVLPTFFLADGFWSEFGTIIGDSGASRLTTAFMMSLVRKNLVASPIGWISWAVQVLMATYYPSSSMLDQVVMVVGLSSIRLIRYLEGERLKDKNLDRKST